MVKTFVLNRENLSRLAAGERVLIKSDPSFEPSGPALVVGIQQEEFVFVYIGDGGTAEQGRLALEDYGDDWTVYIEDGFFVRTPEGLLHAYSKHDPEYPGIAIDLYRPGDEEYGIGLAITEYVPAGEGLCGYDASNPVLSRQEIDEVPAERIETEDGQPVASKNGITPANAGSYRITAGLITRAWPDELNDVDNHRRVFHFRAED